MIIVVGMEAEAEIVRQACPKALVVVGADDAAGLAANLEAAIAAGADRVISVGICGGLAPDMQVGDIVIGMRIVYQLAEVACDMVWASRINEALAVSISSASIGYGTFTWSPTAVGRLADKTALRKATGADCVDEETFIAGSIAAAKGLPFAALRVVSDPADFELPPAALTKLTAAGALDMGAILRSIAGDPWQIPALVELAGSSATAMGNFRAALARVGDDFAAA